MGNVHVLTVVSGVVAMSHENMQGSFENMHVSFQDMKGSFENMQGSFENMRTNIPTHTNVVSGVATTALCPCGVKDQVSCAKEIYKRDYILQKRRIF